MKDDRGQNGTVAWVAPEQLPAMDLCPADRELLPALRAVPRPPRRLDTLSPELADMIGEAWRFLGPVKRLGLLGRLDDARLSAEKERRLSLPACATKRF